MAGKDTNFSQPFELLVFVAKIMLFPTAPNRPVPAQTALEEAPADRGHIPTFRKVLVLPVSERLPLGQTLFTNAERVHAWTCGRCGPFPCPIRLPLPRRYPRASRMNRLVSWSGDPPVASLGCLPDLVPLYSIPFTLFPIRQRFRNATVSLNALSVLPHTVCSSFPIRSLAHG